MKKFYFLLLIFFFICLSSCELIMGILSNSFEDGSSEKVTEKPVDTVDIIPVTKKTIDISEYINSDDTCKVWFIQMNQGNRDIKSSKTASLQTVYTSDNNKLNSRSIITSEECYEPFPYETPDFVRNFKKLPVNNLSYNMLNPSSHSVSSSEISKNIDGSSTRTFNLPFMYDSDEIEYFPYDCELK